MNANVHAHTQACMHASAFINDLTSLYLTLPYLTFTFTFTFAFTLTFTFTVAFTFTFTLTYLALHCIAFHCLALPGIVLHCTAFIHVHCITIRYIYSIHHVLVI